jgi:fucose permease
MRAHLRPPVLLAYATFVLVGTSAGVGGVLLLAQLTDYGVDRTTIGITFFTGSVGFVLGGLTTGPLLHRYGQRITMTVGGAAFLLVGLFLASRPPFAAFVLAQLVVGYAGGVLESALNAYLTTLPDAPTLLNRLHAFFGVGALIGPALATWIVGAASWTVVWLVLAVACAPLLAGFLFAYPRTPRPGDEAPSDAAPADPPAAAGGLLRTALVDRGVLLGSALLTVYVGLELGVGNWAYSYLVNGRGLSALLAGYSVSGYWLGLTLGRFVISPVAARLGATVVGLMSTSIAGVAVAATLAWLSPGRVLAGLALIPLGFFLGPIFPTTMAIAPQLTAERLVPSAIGVMNAGSVVGGAALPWLAGALGQEVGIWTLLPFAVTLALLQFAVWWPIANRIRVPRPVPRTT